MTAADVDPVRSTVVAGFDDWLAELMAWLRIPSVSADPAHHGDVLASADFLAEALRRTGFPTVEVWTDTPALPAVYAHWPSGDPDALRVVVYGHHDVQPADGEERWHHPPFEPQIVDGVLHGRGASDDKGNIFMHLLGVRAHLAATGRTAPAVDLTLLVEGEEESGSPHIGRIAVPARGTDLGRSDRGHRHRHVRRRHPERLRRDARSGRRRAPTSTDPTSTCTRALSAAAC